MIDFNTIKRLIELYGARLEGNARDVSFDCAAHYVEADSSSIVWISEGNHSTRANTVVTGEGTKIARREGQVVIRCANSKALFAEIVNEFLVGKPVGGIDSTAHVHPEAKIHPSVRIGALSVIGKCEIGAGSDIDAHVVIHDETVIGEKCIISAGVVLGVKGSGLVKNQAGKWMPFPQIGGLVLGNYVSVGANSYVARGALQNTTIGDHTHIGLSCCIGHNVTIGENTLILANSTLSGGTTVGNNVWISPGSTLVNKVTIGDGAIIGQASNVMRNVAASTTVYGNPGKEK